MPLSRGAGARGRAGAAAGWATAQRRSPRPRFVNAEKPGFAGGRAAGNSLLRVSTCRDGSGLAAQPVARLVANICVEGDGVEVRRLWMRSMSWSKRLRTAGWLAWPRLITPGWRYFAASARRNWGVTTSESENEPSHVVLCGCSRVRRRGCRSRVCGGRRVAGGRGGPDGALEGLGRAAGRPRTPSAPATPSATSTCPSLRPSRSPLHGGPGGARGVAVARMDELDPVHLSVQPHPAATPSPSPVASPHRAAGRPADRRPTIRRCTSALRLWLDAVSGR